MKQPFRHHVPLLWPTLGLIVGIVASALWQPAVPMLPVLMAGVAATALSFRWAALQSVLLVADFVVLGMVLGTRDLQQPVIQGPVEAIIVGEPVERPKTVGVDLLMPATEHRARYFLKKDERSLALQLGDELVVDHPENTFVAAWQWHRGGQAYHHMSRLARARLWFLEHRHRLLQRYRQADIGDDEYAVLAAMTLGDKSALTAQLRETYSVTGASHVLALSGMHLGMVYMLLSWLTLGRRRFWLSQVVIVMSIWAFAFLTGLSTSVIRSATMISIYALFSIGGRRHSSVNLLCFAAMAILLWDASTLFDVGFQLSFLAVLSILLFVPLLTVFVPVQSRWLKWVRDMVCVSVAAQIGVAPLIAFYFGRFSTYFLLTNFVVLPAATVILYGALAFMLVPALGSVLAWVVQSMNKALGWIAQMPCSSVDGLQPTIVQLIFVYLLIACIYVVTLRLSSAVYRSGWPRSSAG